MALKNFMSADDIRTLFSNAMSQLYQHEVPAYRDLLQLVQEVNQQQLAAQDQLSLQKDDVHRLNVERHGAIRVGTGAELNMLRRVFAIMGMAPVGYYDLSVAGVPVHSTAFRPINPVSLRRNPFRMFTSLLRLELIADDALRAQAATILAKRDIFSSKARLLVSQAEALGGLNPSQAQQFVTEILTTFRWHPEAKVDVATYQQLHAAHPLLADIVAFSGPHINHLTPRTLDIDAVQQQMSDVGLTPKSVIEGPPRRQCPILLRQTSFQALVEPVQFADQQTGTHTARFGEVEARGMALTPKGRALYDELLQRAQGAPPLNNDIPQDNAAYQRQLAQAFADFPDDETSLRTQQLGCFHYQLTAAGQQALNTPHLLATQLEDLIAQGLVSATPITYEDFLPVSAAGIFQSNLASANPTTAHFTQGANQDAFEAALGCPVLGEFTLYAKLQQDSLTELKQQLGYTTLS